MHRRVIEKRRLGGSWQRHRSWERDLLSTPSSLLIQTVYRRCHDISSRSGKADDADTASMVSWRSRWWTFVWTPRRQTNFSPSPKSPRSPEPSRACNPLEFPSPGNNHISLQGARRCTSPFRCCTRSRRQQCPIEWGTRPHPGVRMCTVSSSYATHWEHLPLLTARQ